MQLIAMSSLTSFRKKEATMVLYIASVKELLSKVMAMQRDAKQDDEEPKEIGHHKILCIIIGSQKGLCGSFNTQLRSPIREFMEQHPQNDYDVAVVGSQAIKVAESKNIPSIIYAEPIFSHRTRDSITEQLLKKAMEYESVYVISNHFRSFFAQETLCTLLFPLIPKDSMPYQEDTQYIFDEPIQDIERLLLDRYMRAQLSFLLYQSLLSEYAARFTSMESATRNAQTLLEQTKTTFNKLRQAKITTEITELSANF